MDSKNATPPSLESAPRTLGRTSPVAPQAAVPFVFSLNAAPFVPIEGETKGLTNTMCSVKHNPYAATVLPAGYSSIPVDSAPTLQSNSKQIPGTIPSWGVLLDSAEQGLGSVPVLSQAQRALAKKLATNPYHGSGCAPTYDSMAALCAVSDVAHLIFGFLPRHDVWKIRPISRPLFSGVNSYVSEEIIELILSPYTPSQGKGVESLREVQVQDALEEHRATRGAQCTSQYRTPVVLARQAIAATRCEPIGQTSPSSSCESDATSEDRRRRAEFAEKIFSGLRIPDTLNPFQRSFRLLMWPRHCPFLQLLLQWVEDPTGGQQGKTDNPLDEQFNQCRLSLSPSGQLALPPGLNCERAEEFTHGLQTRFLLLCPSGVPQQTILNVADLLALLCAEEVSLDFQAHQLSNKTTPTATGAGGSAPTSLSTEERVVRLRNQLKERAPVHRQLCVGFSDPERGGQQLQCRFSAYETQYNKNSNSCLGLPLLRDTRESIIVSPKFSTKTLRFELSHPLATTLVHLAVVNCAHVESVSLQSFAALRSFVMDLDQGDLSAGKENWSADLVVGSDFGYGCRQLRYVRFPSNLRAIRQGTFGGCDELVEVDLSNCTQLTDWAPGCPTDYFYSVGSCGARRIILPPSLRSIGPRFLKSKGVHQLELSHTRLQSLLPHFCEGFEKLSRVTFPNAITTISAFAFSNQAIQRTRNPDAPMRRPECGCSRCLVDLDLTHCTSLTTLQSSVGQHRRQLRTMKLPSSVREIGGSFCSFGHNLQFLDLGSLTELEGISAQFASNCPILTQVTLPPGVKRIHDGFCARCPKLTTVRILSNHLEYIGSCFLSQCNTLRSITFGVGETKSDDTGVLAVRLPHTLTGLGSEFLNHVSGLRDLDLSHCTQLRTLGAEFASGCPDLRSVTLPDSVVHIHGSFCSGCPSLVCFSAQSGNMVSIGDSFLAGCPELVSVDFGSTESRSCSISLEIGSEFCSKCPNLAHVSLPVQTRHIKDSFCQGVKSDNFTCLDLTNTQLTRVGDRFAAHSVALEHVCFPNSLTAVGSGFLEYNVKLEELDLRHTRLAEFGSRFARGCRLLDALNLQLPQSRQENSSRVPK